MKTNGARILESLGIEFELREYEVDPSNPQDLSALSDAKKIAMPPEQVFKTLLTTAGPGIYLFAVIPGDAELDFKKLARAAAGVPIDRSSSMGWSAGLRKAEMVSLKDVQPLTGYIRGGVTVFGAKKPYPVFVDETAILFDRISVSAGARGVQLILSPSDYLRAAEAQTADLTKDQPRSPGAPGPDSGTWETTTPKPEGSRK
jgi:Cys-tRNA(Pro)/Cys-tRNA(Cys) deacylase